MLPVPCDTDTYLRHIYGDYEKLPPLDRIVPHTADVIIYEQER